MIFTKPDYCWTYLNIGSSYVREGERGRASMCMTDVAGDMLKFCIKILNNPSKDCEVFFDGEGPDYEIRYKGKELYITRYLDDDEVVDEKNILVEKCKFFDGQEFKSYIEKIPYSNIELAKMWLKCFRRYRLRWAFSYYDGIEKLKDRLSTLSKHRALEKKLVKAIKDYRCESDMDVPLKEKKL